MLVSAAITDAYREATIITLGDEPDDTEVAEALAMLNSFRKELFGSEFGENLEDWAVPPPSTQLGLPDNLVSPNLSSTWYLDPVPNSRLLVSLQTATTIRFPIEPRDGSRIQFIDVGSASVNVTLSGNGRLIEGGVSIVDTPALLNGAQWFYRADLASWERVADLTTSSVLPLPDEYNNLFICYLAIRLAPRSAQEPSSTTVSTFTKLMKQAKARYRQEQDVAIADRRISQSEQSFGYQGSRDWFN